MTQSEELVSTIRRLRANGASYRTIGREVGVSQQFAWRALNGRSELRPRTRISRSAFVQHHHRAVIGGGTAIVLVSGITAAIAWRRRRGAQAADAQAQRRAQSAAAASRIESAPTPPIDPRGNTPATPVVESPRDPHIDPVPPELAWPLDEYGRAIPPAEEPPPSRRSARGDKE